MGFANESLLMLLQDFSVHFQNVPRVGWTLDKKDVLVKELYFCMELLQDLVRIGLRKLHIWCISER